MSRVDDQPPGNPVPATLPSNPAIRTWAWSSTSLHAVDLEFAIRTENSRLGRYLEPILRSQRSDGRASTLLDVVSGGEGSDGHSPVWDILVDGRRRCRSLRPGQVVPALLGE